MYGCVDLCFGVKLYGMDTMRESFDVSKWKDAMIDIAKYEFDGVDTLETAEFGNPDEWDDDGIKMFVENWLGESNYVESPYTGSGTPPMYIGIQIGSWPYFHSGGEDGFIAAARNDRPLTDEESGRWMSKVPAEVRDILTRHGHIPGFVWGASTS